MTGPGPGGGHGGGFDFVPLAAAERLVDERAVIDRIEQVYRWTAEGALVTSRPTAMRMALDAPRFKSHAKAVILPPLGIAGLRCVGYAVAEDGSGPSAPGTTRLVLLMDLATGAPIALVDEHYNYTLRTAASVAVAARALCPPAPRLGVIGAGGVAQAVIRLFAAVLPLEGIAITSRRAESREALAAEARGCVACPVEAVGSIEAVLETCNLVVTATTTKSVLIPRTAMRPGTLYCALGSFELDGAIYRDADKVLVDDWSQTATAHDMAPLIEAGTFGEDRLHAELAAVVAGEVPGRERDDEVIVVRTEGMASQDIALAHWTWQAARDAGMVTRVGL
ncbi:MAG: hypothetical protein RID91_07275 [Azospirillaceae bacterium]